MTYMAIFETYPLPRITVKRMTTRDAFKYQYYRTGDTPEEAKRMLSEQLFYDSVQLMGLSRTYADAAAFDVEIVDETEAANDDE